MDQGQNYDASHHTPLELETKIQYPSKWFADHPNQKPPCTIPTSTLPLRKLGNFVFEKIGTKALTLDVALAFLHAFAAQRVKATLTESWVSFDVTIGVKNQEITPLSLLDITPMPVRVRRASDVECPEEMLFGLAMYILMVGRFQLSLQNKQYQLKLERRFKFELAVRQIKKPVSPMSGMYRSWGRQSSYQTLAAAFDMFLVKFRRNVYAQLRIGTNYLRDKDGSVLVAFNRFLIRHKLSFSEFCRGLYTETLLDEVLRITEPNNEMDDNYSYAHYSMAMGLASKSPYSAQVNPNLNLFLHSVEELDSHKENAILMGKYLVLGVRLKSVVGRVSLSGEPINDDDRERWYDKVDLVGIKGHLPEPRNGDGQDWLVWVKSCDSNSHPPDYFIREANKRCLTLINVEEGSVGKWLKDSAMAAITGN